MRRTFWWPVLGLILSVTAGIAGLSVWHTTHQTPEADAAKAVIVTHRADPHTHRQNLSVVHTGSTNANAPLLAVVGASFSAGTGPGNPDLAWPEELARMLRWRLAVSADPGAGYVSTGDGARGPFARLAEELDLGRIDPSVVIIQGGHDDIGQPLALIHSRVSDLISTVRRDDPRARIGVLTVFATGNTPTDAALAVDRTIVDAARAADPRVLVFDPLSQHWRFPRSPDHLHPTAEGDHWIATQLAPALRAGEKPQ
ncbi:MAG TPA: SGNH/GDSL hydrolase family protein [Pseudonocardiaceae bacterium]|nr:SGNH/GDSL hydrolase family protein [Pseudonocardiaceae bacterium]